MKNLFLLFSLTLISLVACKSDDEATTEPDLPYYFQDGFETRTPEIAELFPSDGSRWTSLQQVDPMNGENRVQLSSLQFSEGNQSLFLYADPSDEVLSKMDIEKSGFFAPTGSTVTIEADFYISSAADLQNLFLIDLECCSCWDPSVPDNQCPGVRLSLSGPDNYLVMERGKIGGTTLIQAEHTIPRNAWTRIKWQMLLSPEEEDGNNRIFINDEEILSQTAMNLPNATIFREVGVSQGIDFELQSPIGYERLQIGATANPGMNGVELFVDNFSLSIE